MRRVVFYILMSYLQIVNTLAADFPVPVNCKGWLSPAFFGAKADGIHDDTKAIQTTLNFLDSIGGGTVYFDSGTYMVSSIKLGKKTSLIGCGNGATLIKQIKGTKLDCVIVPAKSAALRISNLTIVGNDINCGLNIENSRGGTENHPYLYTKDIKDGVPQPYKWITIEVVCIYHFGTGLNVERSGFNINICNSTISHNGYGAIMKCTDSSMYNCYITNNKTNGLHIVGSNNKISNVKSIFNGMYDSEKRAGILVYGDRNQLVNCETQDNHCSGFMILGQYNLFSNCLSNTDGYSAKEMRYNPAAKAAGFKVMGLYNSFSNCAVTSYTEDYGAVYYSPVIVDEAVSYYYPDIFSDIKVLIPENRLLFNEPFRNIQTLNAKNDVEHARIKGALGNRYFVSDQTRSNIMRSISCQINSLNILVDFKCTGDAGKIITIGDEDCLTLDIDGKKITLRIDGNNLTELVLDDDAVLSKDDLRLIVSFFHNNGVGTVSLLCYEKTAERGWIKKQNRQDIDTLTSNCHNLDLIIGDVGVAVKRMALTNSPLPESVFLPYSNTNRIYDSAFLYLDADSM